MSERVASGRVSKRHQRSPKTDPKLPSLPAGAQVTKRPLLRPALPSPYSGSSQPKVIYVSAKTPFISAVKRAEKLLHLRDKRLVQSATQLNKDAQRRKRRWDKDDDEILGIAREVESAKKKGNEQEDVVLKGTGKAISKVMELGLWFQQREEYNVKLRTGSVGAVDDVQYQQEEKQTGAEPQDGVGDMVVNGTNVDEKSAAKPASSVVKREERKNEDGKTEVNETRIRQLSVLEVSVSLR